MLRDLQYGFRLWQRNKLFGLTIITLLSLGIGANTLIFSFVNVLLLKPLPVCQPDNLFLLEKTRVKQVRPDPSFFYRQFEEVTRESNAVSSAVAEQQWSALSFHHFLIAGSVKLITTQIVSPNYFSELGVRPAAGRVLAVADATLKSEVPVVLSYQFWHAQFGGRSDVVGQTVHVENHPFVIVGILPEEFHGLDVERAPDVRFPISAAPLLTGSTVDAPKGGEPITFNILVRIAPGASTKQVTNVALSNLQAMEAGLWREVSARSSLPWTHEDLEDRIQYEQNYRLGLESAARGISRLRQQFSGAVLILMGGAALLMAAICANVAGLLLAKAESRKYEMALRLAMGAPRRRLLRQLLSEHLLLALPSAILGSVFAYLGAPALVSLLPAPRGYGQYAATPQILQVQPDLRVLFFAVAIAVSSVLVVGLASSWLGLKVDFAEVLKQGGRHATYRDPGRSAAAIGAALAVILLTGSTAMLKTFWTLQHLDPGFDRGHLVEFTIDPETNGYLSNRAAIFRRQLQAKIAELSGVRSVSYSSNGLMRGIGTKTTVTPQGTLLPEQTFLNTSTMSVSPGYFNTLGIPLLSGRSLDARDQGKKPSPIVVNRAFARFFFPRETNVVGKSIVQGIDGRKPPTSMIVGIVGTAKYRSMRELEPPIAYSASSDGTAGTYLYVRTTGNPARIIQAVRHILRNLDPAIPLIEAFTLEQQVQSSLWQERIVTFLAGFFGVVALALSAVGLYGILAHSVAGRSRELAIRIAVGAQVRDIVHTVCIDMAWSVAIGLVTGVFGSILLLREASGLLFGVTPTDPVPLSVAAALLLLCSAVATVGPAWRACKTDSAIVLRQE